MHNRYEEIETIILPQSGFGILNTVVESSRSLNSFKKFYFKKDYYI